MALGIGAVTAVFTLVDGVLVSPLPFDQPEDLVAIELLAVAIAATWIPVSRVASVEPTEALRTE